MIGLYGPVLFGTFGGKVSTFDGFKKSVAARWGVHEVWQDKPAMEYAGASLIEVEFKMTLCKPYTIDPMATVVLLQETMDLALPYPLVLGLFPVGRGLSLFVMTELQTEFQYFYRGGALMGAVCDVKLKEYPNPNIINTLLQALGGAFGSGGGGATAASTATGGTVTTGDLTPVETPPDWSSETPTSLIQGEQPANSLGFNLDTPQVSQTSGAESIDNLNLNNANLDEGLKSD